jgi:hypothetical protein
MALPIVGPFTRVSTAFAPTAYGWTSQILNKNQRWFRQAKPFDLPLEYNMVHQVVVSALDMWNRPVDVSQCSGEVNSTYRNYAYNKAYEKLKANLGEASATMVNLAERKQSIDMIAGRGLQLLRFTNHLRKLQFEAAARDLDLLAPPRKLLKKPGQKALAKNWLEYHFGWEPLVKDIGNSVDLLQRPIPKGKIVGTSNRTDKDVYRFDGGDTRRVDHITTKTQFKLGAQIDVTNPNLFLANQMGFVNPLTVAWELVPFSFVVDWFVNVSDFLSSCSDFVGVDVSHSYQSMLQDITISRDMSYRDPAHPEQGHVTYQSYIVRSVFMNRALGRPPGPVLGVRPPKPLSIVRGATAIALLIGAMGR